MGTEERSSVPDLAKYGGLAVALAAFEYVGLNGWHVMKWNGCGGWALGSHSLLLLLFIFLLVYARMDI